MSTPADPKQWLQFALDDLAAARLLLTKPELPARIACFHAQQAAEKALKASLIQAKVQFRKTHDWWCESRCSPQEYARMSAVSLCSGYSSGPSMLDIRPIFRTSGPETPRRFSQLPNGLSL